MISRNEIPPRIPPPPAEVDPHEEEVADELPPSDLEGILLNTPTHSISYDLKSAVRTEVDAFDVARFEYFSSLIEGSEESKILQYKQAYTKARSALIEKISTIPNAISVEEVERIFIKNENESLAHLKKTYTNESAGAVITGEPIHSHPVLQDRETPAPIRMAPSEMEVRPSNVEHSSTRIYPHSGFEALQIEISKSPLSQPAWKDIRALLPMTLGRAFESRRTLYLTTYYEHEQYGTHDTWANYQDASQNYKKVLQQLSLELKRIPTLSRESPTRIVDAIHATDTNSLRIIEEEVRIERMQNTLNSAPVPEYSNRKSTQSLIGKMGDFLAHTPLGKGIKAFAAVGGFFTVLTGDPLDQRQTPSIERVENRTPTAPSPPTGSSNETVAIEKTNTVEVTARGAIPALRALLRGAQAPSWVEAFEREIIVQDGVVERLETIKRPDALRDAVAEYEAQYLTLLRYRPNLSYSARIPAGSRFEASEQGIRFISGDERMAKSQWLLIVERNAGSLAFEVEPYHGPYDKQILVEGNN